MAPTRPALEEAIAKAVFSDGTTVYLTVSGTWSTRAKFRGRNLPLLLDATTEAYVCVVAGGRMQTYLHYPQWPATFEQAFPAPVGKEMVCSIAGIRIPNSTPIGKALERVVVDFNDTVLPEGKVVHMKRKRDPAIGESVDLEGHLDCRIDGVLRRSTRGRFQLSTQNKISLDASPEALLNTVKGKSMAISVQGLNADEMPMLPGIWLVASR